MRLSFFKSPLAWGTFVLFLAGIISLSISNQTSANDSPSVHKEVLTATSQSWDGAELPTYPTGKPKITILRITIPPHAKLPLHKHPIINAGILTKGELTVVAPDSNKTHTLHAGDAIVEMVNTAHYGINQGETPAEIVVFYAGDETTPLSISD